MGVGQPDKEGNYRLYCKDWPEAYAFTASAADIKAIAEDGEVAIIGKFLSHQEETGIPLLIYRELSNNKAQNRNPLLVCSLVKKTELHSPLLKIMMKYQYLKFDRYSESNNTITWRLEDQKVSLNSSTVTITKDKNSLEVPFELFIANDFELKLDENEKVNSAKETLNKAIKDNPASSIAKELTEQGGQYQFTAGEGGVLAVKFNGQAIEVATLIKQMAAEIPLSKLEGEGGFKTECGETLRLGASYTLGPCGIITGDEAFQFGISKTGQEYADGNGVGDVNGEFSVCLGRGCTFNNRKQVDILGEGNRRVSVPLDPSKLRLEVVEDESADNNCKIVMTYGEKELCSKSVSKDELEKYSIGVSYDENDRSGKTAHITEERFTKRKR